MVVGLRASMDVCGSGFFRALISGLGLAGRVSALRFRLRFRV